MQVNSKAIGQDAKENGIGAIRNLFGRIPDAVKLTIAAVIISGSAVLPDYGVTDAELSRATAFNTDPVITVINHGSVDDLLEVVNTEQGTCMASPSNEIQNCEFN